MLVNSRKAARRLGESSHHGLHYDVGWFPERAVNGHARAVGHRPLSLHGPTVGFPRGQQVLESLEKEEDRHGEASQRAWFPSSPRVPPVCCVAFAKLVPSLDPPFHPLTNRGLELRSLQALNEGRVPAGSFLGQALLTHFRDRGTHASKLFPHSFFHGAEIHLLVIPVPLFL